MSIRILPLLGLSVVALAQAPDKLSGLIYRETTAFIDGGLGATVLLEEGGKYSSLIMRYTSSRAEIVTAGYPVNPPEKGSFAYQRTGPSTARLTFTPIGASGAMAASGERTMTFSATDQGRLAVSFDRNVTGLFWLSSPTGPLLNSASRGVASATKPLILGFVVGDRYRDVIVRAAGPGLAQFGVADAASDTVLELHWADGRLASTNDDWWNTGQRETAFGAKKSEMQVVTSFVGAFSFQDTSRDSALIRTVPPGSWTVVVRTKSETLSEVLAEVYVIP